MLLLMDLLSHPVSQNIVRKCIPLNQHRNSEWGTFKSIFKIRIGYKEKQIIKRNFIVSFGQILSD